MKTVILAFLTILFSTLSVKSCDCVLKTKCFMDEFNYDYIIHARIIDNLQYFQKEKEIGNDFYGLTIMEVIKSFKFKYKSDTIVFANYDSNFCGNSISNSKPGSEILLKANSHDLKYFDDFITYYPFEKVLTKQDTILLELAKKYKVITNGSCEFNELKIEHNKVYGNITLNLQGFRNKIRENLKIVFPIMSIIYYKTISTLKQNPILQTEEVYSLIEDKLQNSTVR